MMGPSNDNTWTVDLELRELLVLLRKPILKVHSNMPGSCECSKASTPNLGSYVSKPYDGS